MAVTQVTFNLIDHSGEMTRTQVSLPELLANGSNYAAITASVDVLQTALLLASACTHVSTTISILVDTGAGTPPATVTAQREIAIRVKLRDTVTGRFGFLTCPGPVTGFYPPTGVKGDYIPLDNIIFAAFIVAMEAEMVSQDGNSIEVVEGRLVGRNS